VITRTVRIQVLIFVVVSLLGVAYIGVRYVGLGDRLLGRTYTVNLDLGSAGGIFPHAAVAYRGVPVGEVAGVTLHGDGVLAALRIKQGVQIPADLTAVVAQRSAIGEQYVDLRPNRDAGPYLRDGDMIPQEHTSLPLPMETLLSSLDGLVQSVGVENLSIVIDELGKAFEGNERALKALLDANSLLLQDTDAHMSQIIQLLHDGQTVLTTQAESADAIQAWAASLAQLAQTLRDSDGDLRLLLAAGPPAAAVTVHLLHDLDPSLGVLLGNLVTVGDITVRRLPGIEQLLVAFPITVAGGLTVAPGDGTAHFGLVVNLGDPPACTYASGAPAQCTATQQAAGSDVRGALNAPRAGGPAASNGRGSTGAPSTPAEPAPTSGATVVGFDPATGVVLGPDGKPLQFGATGGQYAFSGDESWKQLLFSGLEP
jgi:phospholipid/cholesterol/gamma-HCH transport system substrate-binding protein